VRHLRSLFWFWVRKYHALLWLWLVSLIVWALVLWLVLIR